MYDYPVVSKQLREYYAKTRKCAHDHDHEHGHDHGHCEHKHEHQGPSHNHHMCGHNIMEHGLGYADLDALFKTPKDLEFIFEVIRVEQPGEYEKETWTLSDDERMKLIPKLKEEGNALFKEAKYEEAGAKYQEAVGLLEQFMLREKPNDIEWNELNELKVPILLNFSMCKFNLKEYYSCIEHTTTILETKPGHVKALFRRAKAYAAVWSLKEARDDFNKCAQLDPTLAREVEKQLAELVKAEKEHKMKENEMFRGKLFN